MTDEEQQAQPQHCAWCGFAEAAHGAPGASAMAREKGQPHWRMCPIEGVTSQFYTTRKD